MPNHSAGLSYSAVNVVPLPARPRQPEFELAWNGVASAVGQAPVAGGSAHSVRYCVSLPLLGRRYFLAFIIGREKRSLERLAVEGHAKSWFHTMFSLSAVTMFVSSMAVSTIAFAYLLKSLVGIDLFEDHFILHGLFFT